MELKIKSIHFDATEKLEDFIGKKAAKLEKKFEDLSELEVQLKVTKPATAMNKEVSLTALIPGSKFFIEKVADSFEEAFDDCLDSLKVQLTKYKEKLRER